MAKSICHTYLIQKVTMPEIQNILYIWRITYQKPNWENPNEKNIQLTEKFKMVTRLMQIYLNPPTESCQSNKQWVAIFPH